MSLLSQGRDEEIRDTIRSYHCYNPHNLQAARAGTNLSAYAFVGITEEMQRSVCLLSYFVRGRLPQQCNCNRGPESNEVGRGGGGRSTLQHVHETHGVGKHVGTSEEDRRMILPLVQNDILLYETAKIRFNEALHHVESVTNTTICKL